MSAAAVETMTLYVAPWIRFCAGVKAMMFWEAPDQANVPPLAAQSGVPPVTKQGVPLVCCKLKADCVAA